MRVSRLISLFALVSIFALPSGKTMAAPSYGSASSNFQRTYDHSYFIVFTDKGQRSSGDVSSDRNALLFGSGGTIVKTQKQGIGLCQGKLFVKCSRDMNIGTGNALAKLAANSSIHIERKSRECEVIELVSGTATVVSGSNTINLVAPQAITVTRLEDNNVVAQSNSVSSAAESDMIGTAEAARIFAQPGASFSVAHRAINVLRGSVFVDLPPRNTLHTPAAKLQSRQRSLLSVRMSARNLCIENCSTPSETYLISKGQRYSLFSGQSCIFQNGRPRPGLLPHDGVMRRRLEAQFDGTLSMITCDFEMHSLLQNHGALIPGIAKPITSNERVMLNRILKTATALNVATADRGEFASRPGNIMVSAAGSSRVSVAQK